MADIIMTILAALAIIAGVGLIAAIVMGISTVRNMIGTGKGAVKMIDKPKAKAIKLADTAKLHAFKLRDRALIIGANVKTSADSIKQIKTDIETITNAVKGEG